MNKPPLSPINDYVFKRVFGENLTVLSDLLQAVLAMPVTKHDICVVNPIFAADKKQDKLSALDVKVETRDYGVIDVEIQLEYYDDLWKRFQYYTARMYVDQIRSGDDYAKLTRAISIVITDFSFFMHDIAYHHRFRMYDAQNGLEYPGSIEINILEIPKRRGNISKVSHWLEFFAARTEEQFMQLAQNDSAMEQAWGIIKHMSADEQERAEAEAVEKARRDMVARLHSAEMLGHTKGLEEGKAEGKAEVALAMLQGGLSIEQISGFTGLTADEIQGLRKLQ
ncbi:MAG: Rpn family recombination-promoting nuclease/putative transposase [Desulfovibrio sp.]|nr:Rpn family recombination-promoting nuclease/putative transposase [Desulfovibrio sp.]